MNILFAAADRDLLAGFRALLEGEGYRVETAFDGTQVLIAAEENAPDVAILDSELPRVSVSRLLSALRERNVPVILLLPERLRSTHYLSPELPDSFLCYPFSPQELEQRIALVLSERREAPYSLGQLPVKPEQRTLGSEKVTAEELALLRSLSSGGAGEGKDPALPARALNEKLCRMREPFRIRYLANQGYRMVNAHE